MMENIDNFIISLKLIVMTDINKINGQIQKMEKKENRHTCKNILK